MSAELTGASRAASSRAARAHLPAAALMFVIAGVHFQQYVDFMSEIPTIGVLFLLNAAGGAALAVVLLGRDPLLRALAALASAGLAVGSLVSIILALNGGIFGYQEPSLRLPIVIAIVAEVAVMPFFAVVALPALQSVRAARSTTR